MTALNNPQPKTYKLEVATQGARSSVSTAGGSILTTINAYGDTTPLRDLGIDASHDKRSSSRYNSQYLLRVRQRGC